MTSTNRGAIPAPPDVSYWDSSSVLRAVLDSRLDPAQRSWAWPMLEKMGEFAPHEVAPLAAIADREGPVLRTHDERGERIDEVIYHPAYRQMERIAYGSGMIFMKYDAPLRERLGSAAVQMGCFALGYLFAMAEEGLYCPVCMTDGVARILSRHGSASQIEAVVPHLTAHERPSLWTGAMFLTERSGGSDVGRNETSARRAKDGTWRLTGEKWFCSNVDAEAVLVTARPEGAAEGTRGLRTYLLIPRQTSGVTIERLKPKLGVRSMPTGEVTLRDARAEDVGGFPAMLEMLNLSRLYNAVGSVAVVGRAILEARHYVERREAFGRRVADLPLARETLLDLEAEHAAAVQLTFAAIEALGRADDGDADAERLLRLLTPVAKATTGKLAVPAVSEAMELIGGNGYIEESPLPRLLRDAQVLPIWEGTTNILALDTIRAARKANGHELMTSRIAARFPKEAQALRDALPRLEERQARSWMDRLARLYGVTLLVEGGREDEAERLLRRPMGLLPGATVWLD